MSTVIKALLCLLAISICVFADITVNTPIDSNESSGSGIGPAKDTLNNEGAGSSSYGNIGGFSEDIVGGTNTSLNPGNYENTSNEYLYILLEIHRENDRLEKITTLIYKIIALLSLITLEIILSVLFIKKDEKFVKEFAPLFIAASIIVLVFIICT